MRQALQYQRLAGRVLALHEEDPALSRKGVMHEGIVSASLGVAGIPSVSESTMVARDGTGRLPQCHTTPHHRRLGWQQWIPPVVSSILCKRFSKNQLS